MIDVHTTIEQATAPYPHLFVAPPTIPSDGLLVAQAEGVLPGDSDEHRCGRHPGEGTGAFFPFRGLHQLGSWFC